MDNKHLDFNAELLFKRKDKHCGYRFCPLCGEALKEEKIDNHQRMICTREVCDFIYYQNPIPAAGAIIVENNKILLVKRAHPPKIGWWCLPAGFMEWKEHPAQTAVREVAEETGLNIKITSFFDVYSSTDDPRSNSI
ncbi:MAG: NUDIX domain-containing protein, partial [Candidatus Zixiibacteriota bacterium]